MDLTLNLENGIRFNFRSCILIIKNDKILVEKNPSYHHVSLPGGRVKTKESTLKTIIREMQEELGVTFQEKDLEFCSFMENFFIFENEDFHELMTVYKVHVDDNFPIKNHDLNKDSFGNYYLWLNKEELKEYNLIPKTCQSLLEKNEFEHFINE